MITATWFTWFHCDEIEQNPWDHVLCMIQLLRERERDWVGFQWSEVSIAIGIGAGIGLDRYRSEVKVFSYATEVWDVDPHGTTYAGNMPVMFCITFGTVTMTIWVSGISRYSELLCQCCLFKKIGISASVKEGLLCTNQFGRVESGSTE